MDNVLPAHPPAFPAVSRDSWRTRVSKELGDAPLESLHSRTEDGLDLAPLYTESDLPGQLPQPRIAERAGGWDIRVETSRPSPVAAAAALRNDLNGGASSILLRFHTSGGARSAQQGVRIRNLAELGSTLEGVHVQMIPVALDAGADFVAAAAALAELWEQRGVASHERVGEFGADPLAALAESGTLPCSVASALEQLGELASWSAAELPQVAAVGVDTGVHHDAGCTPAQEIGIALATGLVYMRAMGAAGITPNDAARQIVFHLRAGTEQFQEIAKLRAFRLCWQRALELMDAGGAPVRLTVTLAGRTLTRRDPWVNMLRGTMGCFVAVAGGADSVIVPPFDSALGIPDSVALRLARNTQHVLNEEAHIGAVSDPAAGSWFVESLTQRLAEAGWNQMRDIEGAGGMDAALVSGWVAAQVASAREAREAAVARRERPITGVTVYPDENEVPLERAQWPDEAAEQPPGNHAAPGAYDGSISRVAFARQALQAGASLRQVTAAISDSTPAASPRMEPRRLSAPYESGNPPHDSGEAQP